MTILPTFLANKVAASKLKCLKFNFRRCSINFSYQALSVCFRSYKDLRSLHTLCFCPFTTKPSSWNRKTFSFKSPFKKAVLTSIWWAFNPFQVAKVKSIWMVAHFVVGVKVSSQLTPSFYANPFSTSFLCAYKASHLIYICSWKPTCCLLFWFQMEGLSASKFHSLWASYSFCIVSFHSS